MAVSSGCRHWIGSSFMKALAMMTSAQVGSRFLVHVCVYTTVSRYYLFPPLYGTLIWYRLSYRVGSQSLVQLQVLVSTVYQTPIFNNNYYYWWAHLKQSILHGNVDLDFPLLQPDLLFMVHTTEPVNLFPHKRAGRGCRRIAGSCCLGEDSLWNLRALYS